MGDRRKCQTYTASPAEPGGLPVMLEMPFAAVHVSVQARIRPSRPFGEGRTRGEVIDTCIHAIRRGSGYGTSEGSFAITGETRRGRG
jgi:hypothetical protein